MKFFRLIAIVSFLLYSCTDKERVFSDNSVLKGNWASFNNNTYQEYYVNGESMYIYDPYSGNTLQYNYVLKNDSVFRRFVHIELKNKKHEFYSRVVKFDDNQINFKHKTLYRLKDTNTLEMFIKKEIDPKVYYESCSTRESIISSAKSD